MVSLDRKKYYYSHVRTGSSVPVPWMANAVIKRGFSENIFINPMKLQRILFIAAALYGKRNNRFLFGEDFCTWEYGPVIPSLYFKLRPYKG